MKFVVLFNIFSDGMSVQVIRFAMKKLILGLKKFYRAQIMVSS